VDALLPMTQPSITFEMTDAVMTQAVKEECIVFAREHIRLRELLLVAASAAIFFIALDRGSHWLWWLAALPAGMFALLTLGWFAGYLWLPRLARSRIAHLPHRNVQVEMADEHLAFETATERLQVKWNELKNMKRLPSYWVFCLKSGARIPVPIELVNVSVRTRLQQHLQAHIESSSRRESS
jgi:hypothetical protein